MHLFYENNQKVSRNLSNQLPVQINERKDTVALFKSFFDFRNQGYGGKDVWSSHEELGTEVLVDVWDLFSKEWTLFVS